ncbi:unnamed protein product [Caenorhabditis sp. 36 PRJEB53466]|nr:unnamed protein product [Caenorhabditis sp. 36 PRJEB53466]
MSQSRVLDTRRRYRELYADYDTTVDYGSMENFANAHREYIRKMREYQARQGHRRQLEAWQWAQFLNSMMLPGFYTPPVAEPVEEPPQVQRRFDAITYDAAPFIRRLFAEFIDFLFFLALKIFVIGALIEIDVIDLRHFGQALEDEQDIMQFINLAQELLPIEFISKVGCCIIEGLIMAYGLGPIGKGQSPGKWIAGIRVLSCYDVTAGELPEHVVVEGPNVIGVQQSLKRSFMKNVIVNSLFPLSTAAFQINNGRVFYDMVMKTVVIMVPQ